MFSYIDTDNDNNIQYTEFCELWEEARRGIDPYRIEKKLNRGQSSQDNVNKKSKLVTLGGMFDRKSSLDDDEIISQSLASFKRKQKHQTMLPSEINSSYTYGIKSPVPESISSIMTYEPLNHYIEESMQKERKIQERYRVVKNIFK